MGEPDALGEGVALGETVALGQSSHTDVIQASAHAYVAALNKLAYLRAHRPASSTHGP